MSASQRTRSSGRASRTTTSQREKPAGVVCISGAAISFWISTDAPYQHLQEIASGAFTNPSSVRSPCRSGPFTLTARKPGVLHLVPRWRTQVSALESSVLVLNSGYTAVRITNARRAFILLIREAAEVVTTDAGQFQTYDLASWILWSELVRTGSSFDAQAEEHDPPDWVHTPRLVIAVPRVIRLLRYSGRPQREVRLTPPQHSRSRPRSLPLLRPALPEP